MRRRLRLELLALPILGHCQPQPILKSHQRRLQRRAEAAVPLLPKALPRIRRLFRRKVRHKRSRSPNRPVMQLRPLLPRVILAAVPPCTVVHSDLVTGAPAAMPTQPDPDSV